MEKAFLLRPLPPERAYWAGRPIETTAEMLHKAEEAVSGRPYIGELRRRLLLWHGVARPRLRVTARRGGTAAGGWKGSRISRRGTWAGGTFGALSGGSPGTKLAGRCWSWWTGAGSLTSRDTSNCTSGTRRWVGVLALAQDPGRPRAVPGPLQCGVLRGRYRGAVRTASTWRHWADARCVSQRRNHAVDHVPHDDLG